MQKELKLIVIALCFPLIAFAQKTNTNTEQPQADDDDDTAFTFTEAQLGEDDNTMNTISIVGSNHNVYANDVGYRFSAARFKYRALGGRYNEMFINGNPVNDVERGEFNFAYVGGLNNQTRNADHVLPFEDNNFGMTALGGSNNYNFRPSSMPTGHRFSLSGANRAYTVRAMYSYNSGVSKNGWIFSGGLTYRWASMETANVEGTFYNALSYYLGIEKIINEKHSISLVTWGNPTERATQAGSTDEMYWIANNPYYNPMWGYQDGKKRSSSIAKTFAPSALLTWDFKISNKTKLVTSLLGKYSMYSKSSLDYSNSTNPRPDYYSLMPSYYYDVWGTGGDTGATALANWRAAYDYLSVKENRQLNWDKLYYANKSASLQGADAMYWLRAYHDDQLAFSLSSNLNHKLNATDEISLGLNVSTTKGMHYQTLEDLLGATSFHNINNYAVGTYAETGDEVQYDLNNPNQVVNKGDKYAYDYNIIVNKATLWATYATSFMNASRAFLSARITGTSMQRDGKMRNGLFANNSYGKSGTAYFLDGGAKVGLNFNLGKGNNILLGMHLESKAPTARTAFLAPQMNNEFVQNLKPETNLGFELGYTLTTSWLQASLNGYFNQLHDVTEYSMAYNDIDHSFTYISLTGIQKEYYGVELGLNFKVTDWLNVKALGTISEAKYTNNSNVVYMRSDGQKGADGSYFYKDVCLNKDMREGGTPLTAASIDLSYHNSGWFIDLIGNWYDRIYLYYSPIIRYESDFPDLNNDGVREIPDGALDQAKGKGGFMLDASIGKSMFLKKGRSISINLMLSNILNNRKICTGGMEQNRKDLDENGDAIRTYNFKNNPRKFYAFGINGMLNITYKF
jgi:hypothetical protein